MASYPGQNDELQRNLETSEGQALKYAEELSALYKSERSKRKAIEIANRQLQELSKQLQASLAETNKAHLEMIRRLSLTAELKDEDTGDHLKRMSQYSAILAKGLGLASEEVDSILYAAPMHDIGKVGIPDKIMLKSGKLSSEEFEEIKKHTVIGAKILSGSQSSLVNLAEKIALHHHEKWDGTGYPNGLLGEQISLPGRIVALADTFDALTSRRPYKDPYPFEVAKDIILKEGGRSFDPKIIDVFMQCHYEFKEIKLDVDGDFSHPAKIDFQLSERDT